MALQPYGFRHDGVIYEFNCEPQEDEAVSRALGRKVFKDVEVLNATIPGSKNQSNSDLVTDDLIERKGIRAHYEAWKAGERSGITGAPLQNLGGLSPAQIKSLTANGFPTIEAFAEMDDALLNLLGPNGRSLRDAARAMTGFNEDPALAATNKKLIEDNAALNARADAQASQLEELREQLKALQSAKGGEPKPAKSSDKAA